MPHLGHPVRASFQCPSRRALVASTLVTLCVSCAPAQQPGRYPARHQDPATASAAARAAAPPAQPKPAAPPGDRAATDTHEGSAASEPRVVQVAIKLAPKLLPDITVKDGGVRDAASVLHDMRIGFGACYRYGLRQHPGTQGTIKLSIRVDPTGKVQHVEASTDGNFDPAQVKCVRIRAGLGEFAPQNSAGDDAVGAPGSGDATPREAAGASW